MEDGDTVCKPGAGIGDVDSENKDPDQTCKNIYRQLSGFLFAKRDGGTVPHSCSRLRSRRRRVFMPLPRRAIASVGCHTFC